MHVLMISLDTALATQPDGDARQRHREYAARAGRLTVVVYTPPSGNFVGTQHAVSLQQDANLVILPTHSRSRFTFAWDAVQIALNAVQDAPPDMITTQDPFMAGLAGWWLRNRLHVPLLVQNHSYFIDNAAWLAEHPLRNRAFNALGKWLIRRTDTHRTCNQQERATYLALGGTEERVFTFPLSTASERFAEPIADDVLQALRAKLRLLPTHKVILWVGYPIKVKRLPLLLQVFQRVVRAEPEARLLLVGDLSRSPDDLAALLAQLGVQNQVITPGNVLHDDLPAYYQLAQVYAMTSLYEGIPRVLGEAGAAGLPLVGFDRVGVRDVIRDGVNGCLVPEGDIDGMAARLLTLLREPETARTLGTAAREIALRDYNAANNQEAVIAAWEKTVQLGRR